MMKKVLFLISGLLLLGGAAFLFYWFWLRKKLPAITKVTLSDIGKAQVDVNGGSHVAIPSGYQEVPGTGAVYAVIGKYNAADNTVNVGGAAFPYISALYMIDADNNVLAYVGQDIDGATWKDNTGQVWDYEGNGVRNNIV